MKAPPFKGGAFVCSYVFHAFCHAGRGLVTLVGGETSHVMSLVYYCSPYMECDSFS